jgi:hypothetical protein
MSTIFVMRTQKSVSNSQAYNILLLTSYQVFFWQVGGGNGGFNLGASGLFGKQSTTLPTLLLYFLDRLLHFLPRPALDCSPPTSGSQVAGITGMSPHIVLSPSSCLTVAQIPPHRDLCYSFFW